MAQRQQRCHHEHRGAMPCAHVKEKVRGSSQAWLAGRQVEEGVRGPQLEKRATTPTMPRGRDRRAAADGGGAKRGGWRRRAAAAADESSAPKRARKNGVAAVVGATAATATAAAAAPAAAPAAAAAAGAGARAGARPRLQLITANVGSVFEDKVRCPEGWAAGCPRCPTRAPPPACRALSLPSQSLAGGWAAGGGAWALRGSC